MRKFLTHGTIICIFIALCIACNIESEQPLDQEKIEDGNVTVNANPKTFEINGGGVNLPGIYNYEQGLSVERAVDLAGGISSCGILELVRIKVVRTVEGKKETGKILHTDLVWPSDVITIPCR